MFSNRVAKERTMSVPKEHGDTERGAFHETPGTAMVSVGHCSRMGILKIKRSKFMLHSAKDVEFGLQIQCQYLAGSTIPMVRKEDGSYVVFWGSTRKGVIGSYPAATATVCAVQCAKITEYKIMSFGQSLIHIPHKNSRPLRCTPSGILSRRPAARAHGTNGVRLPGRHFVQMQEIDGGRGCRFVFPCASGVCAQCVVQGAIQRDCAEVLTGLCRGVA